MQLETMTKARDAPVRCYDYMIAAVSPPFNLETIQANSKVCRNLPMRPILMPDRAKARRALCAPGPGVLVLLPPVALSLMCTAVIPSSCTVVLIMITDDLELHTKKVTEESAPAVPCI